MPSAVVKAKTINNEPPMYPIIFSDKYFDKNAT